LKGNYENPKSNKIHNPHLQRGFKVREKKKMQENDICDHDMWAKLSTEMTEVKMESGVDLAKRPSEVSVSKTGVHNTYSFFHTACNVHILPCIKHFFF